MEISLEHFCKDDQNNEKPTLYFPFIITEDQFKERLYKHFLGNSYLPDNIFNELPLRITKYYLPAYYFKYYFEVTAQGNVIEMEEVMERNPNTGTGRPVLRPKAYPFKIPLNGSAEIFVSASDKYDETTLFSHIPYVKHIGEVTHTQDPYSSFEEFSIAVDKAALERSDSVLADEVKSLARKYANAAYNNKVPQKPFEIEITNRYVEETDRYFLPYWKFDYNYDGKNCYEMVDAVNNFLSHNEPVIDKNKKSGVSEIRSAYYSLGLILSVIIGFFYYKFFDKTEDSSGFLITLATCFLIVIIVAESTISSTKDGWKKQREQKLKEVFQSA